MLDVRVITVWSRLEEGNRKACEVVAVREKSVEEGEGWVAAPLYVERG